MQKVFVLILSLFIFNNSNAFSFSACLAGIKNTAAASVSLVSLAAKKTASVAVSSTKFAGKVLAPVVKPVANHPYISLGVFCVAGFVSAVWCLKKTFSLYEYQRRNKKGSIFFNEA